MGGIVSKPVKKSESPKLMKEYLDKRQVRPVKKTEQILEKKIEDEPKK
jgi:hypothetical protein